MEMPLHHHHRDGGLRPGCKRCQLEAAAPDLLEALRNLWVAYLDSLTDNKGCTCLRCTGAAQAAKAAIAKATE